MARKDDLESRGGGTRRGLSDMAIIVGAVGLAISLTGWIYTTQSKINDRLKKIELKLDTLADNLSPVKKKFWKQIDHEMSATSPLHRQESAADQAKGPFLNTHTLMPGSTNQKTHP